MEHTNGLSLTMDTFLLLGNEQEYSNTLGLMIINQIRFISIYLPSAIYKSYSVKKSFGLFKAVNYLYLLGI